MASLSSESEGEAYELDRIVDSRKRGRTLEYLVRWRGFGENEDSWEPAKNLKKSTAAIKAFETATKSPSRRQSSSRQVEEKVTQEGARNVTRKTTVTKTETRMVSGTQSESSSPESSPLMRRRQTTRTEVTKLVSSDSDSSKKSSRSQAGRGILQVTGMDFPIIVLVVCFLFIALTFAIQLK